MSEETREAPEAPVEALALAWARANLETTECEIDYDASVHLAEGADGEITHAWVAAWVYVARESWETHGVSPFLGATQDFPDRGGWIA